MDDVTFFGLGKGKVLIKKIAHYFILEVLYTLKMTWDPNFQHFGKNVNIWSTGVIELL